MRKSQQHKNNLKNHALKMEIDNRNTEQERNATTERTEQPKPTPARRNPRIVIGNLDYFELLMEQDEE